MTCFKCFKDVYGNHQCRGRAQASGSRAGREYAKNHSLLDSVVVSDGVAGDQLQYMEFDVEEERQARLEEFSDEWPL